MCKIISDEAMEKRSDDDQRRRRKGIPSAREGTFCEFSFGIDLSARERSENVTRRIEATTRRISPGTFVDDPIMFSLNA